MVAITYFSVALISLASLATASPIGEYPSGMVNMESRVLKANSAINKPTRPPQHHQRVDILAHMAHAARGESEAGVINMERRVVKPNARPPQPHQRIDYLAHMAHAIRDSNDSGSGVARLQRRVVKPSSARPPQRHFANMGHA